MEKEMWATGCPTAYWELLVILTTLSGFFPFAGSSSKGSKSLGYTQTSGKACDLGRRIMALSITYYCSFPRTLKNNNTSLFFCQKTPESWGESIGNSRDVEAQPYMTHHKHKICHVFSSISGNFVFPLYLSHFPQNGCAILFIITICLTLKHKSCKYTTKKL